MKTYKIIVGALLAGSLSVLSSCSSSNANNVESLKDFKEFVKDVPQDKDANWAEIDRTYVSKEDAVENDMDVMTADQKEEFRELQKEYAEMKNEALEERADEKAEMGEENNTYIDRLYVLVLDVDRDLAMDDVTAQNIARVYTDFVGYISDHKKEFTIEDWNEAEVIWDALNERKNVVEPELSSSDNATIAELKLQYGYLKTSHKPSAKYKQKVETEKERDVVEEQTK